MAKSETVEMEGIKEQIIDGKKRRVLGGYECPRCHQNKEFRYGATTVIYEDESYPAKRIICSVCEKVLNCCEV